MSYDAIKVLIDAAALILSVAAMLFTYVVWRAGRGRARREELEEIRSKITQIEGDLSHAPSHQDLQRLHDRVSEVNRNVTTLGNSVAGLLKVVEGTSEGIHSLQRTVQQLVDNELAEGREAKSKGTRR
jgi:predicted  nucleic acid-binding Zn-ribbon protein